MKVSAPARERTRPKALRWKLALAALASISSLTGCTSVPEGASPAGAHRANQGESSRFSVRQLGDKWTLVDPAGRPFYSVGVNHVSMDGYADPSGTNVYKSTVTAKYPTQAAWADAQRVRFRDWGINTVAAFSDIEPFLARQVPSTAFIRTTASNQTDFWDPKWIGDAQHAIREAAARYGKDPDLVGYFIDNELPWVLDISAFGAPTSDLFIMSRYLHHREGKVKLLQFLKSRYRSVDELRSDFPAARFAGRDWSALDAATATFGSQATPRGQDTLDLWAQIMARQYFAVTAPTLRQADATHLNLGHKFIGGLTPISVLQIAAPYSDVISVDFYDTRPSRPAPASSAADRAHVSDFQTTLRAAIAFEKNVPTRDMLAEWHRLTGKPILIAEFGYRAMDSGLPNTSPPSVVTLNTQAERADALTNYANCALNAPYIIGIHWFELFDEPAAGRFDGENTNWGIVSGADVPYTPVTTALAAVGRKAGMRTQPGFPATRCNPVGIQDANALRP